ncbi:acyl-CoA thioester hydrolase [Enterobacter cancerogenus]|uniref:Acyl-CoA thioester hydrolase n=1 Tax=Enterobacter cancerogenus TaxID=69218 RepID=A0A484Z9X9_9ENTR|nr:acyl-CoA thioester hydrolase [Enterobacter cancerogenus]
MILAGEQRAGKPGYPWLVFLHGFSGDAREWRAVGEQLGDYPQLYLDLPGHGGSAGISVSGFDQVSQLLTTTLISYNILSYWLVGYSLGGRIAMFHACQQPTGLRGVVVEGAIRGCRMRTRATPGWIPIAAGRSVCARNRSARFSPTGISSRCSPHSRRHSAAS